MNLFNGSYINCDAPKPWGLYFQDSASPQMEALVELHDNIMFYLAIILFGVAWIMGSIIINYVFNRSAISNKYLNHGTLIELIWTITPALILILIAFPSFKLLYLMDEVTDPSLTVFVEGHQWYWSYQYPDFLNNDNEELEFDSYLVPEADLIILSSVDNYTYVAIQGESSSGSDPSGFDCSSGKHSWRTVGRINNNTREFLVISQCRICGLQMTETPSFNPCGNGIHDFRPSRSRKNASSEMEECLECFSCGLVQFSN